MSMPELIDTHCHIQSAGRAIGERTTQALWAKADKANIDEIIDRAAASGVWRMICVGCDVADSRLAVEQVQHRPALYASLGIHPHEANRYVGSGAEPDAGEALREFAELVTAPRVVAIGEAGLDYYYEHSSRANQAEILKLQLESAQKHKLPMIFHVRGNRGEAGDKDAFADFWPIFDKYPGTRGVLHSFTDTTHNLREALNRGLYIGVNGIATFAKDPETLVMYGTVPKNRLLLETDSPFLTPAPYRGTINEPKHISTIANFLAKLRGETPADLADATSKNAKDLFGL